MKVMEWLAEAGFPDAQLEELDGLLVIKLDPRDRNRLLADPTLRDRIVAAARSHAFSRVALEISSAGDSRP